MSSSVSPTNWTPPLRISPEGSDSASRSPVSSRLSPEVLLLDEVTSALDPEVAAEVLDVLRDVASSTDVTMLCVTHAMEFAKDVSDRVLMFCDGSIIESGPPSLLLESPEHERTQRFLRSVLGEG